MLRLGLALVAAALALAETAHAADPLEKARAAVAAMKPGTWRELPNTRMQDVFPKREGHPAWGVVGPHSVTYAWSGAAFDTKRNILVVTGGGHTDYGGNEVYHFSLETLRWTRATEPSPMRPAGGRKGRFEVADGSEAPVSSHTYDGLLYLPNVDRVLKFGGSYYVSGDPYDRHAYLYDVERRRWRRGAEAPFESLEVATAYDPARGEALVTFPAGLMAYDPVRDAWRVLVRSDDHEFGRTADFDPTRRQFVQAGRSGERTIAYYAVDLPAARRVPVLSGDVGFRGAPALAYHPPSRRFLMWSGDREVWALDPASWSARLYRNLDGPAPERSNEGGKSKTRGIYGRWQYVPDLDVLLGYVHSADDVWLYKPPVEAGPR